MNRHTASTTFAVITLGLAFGLAAPPAFAARAAASATSSTSATSATDGGTQKQKKPSTGRKTRIKMAPQHDNGESSADRDRRFRRECRGMPNAGACQGYGYGS